MNKDNIIKEYEIAIIFPSQKDEFKQSKEKILSLFDELDIKVISSEDLKVRELAYMINKSQFGHYYVFHTNASPSKVNKFYKEVSLLEEILRVMVLQTEEEAKKYLSEGNTRKERYHRKPEKFDKQRSSINN